MKHRIDSKNHLFAIFIFSAICPFVLMAAPVIAQQLAMEWGLSPSQIGLFFFVELGMMSLATLPGFYWSKRITFKKASLYAALIFVLGNFLSLFAQSFEFLLVTRAISAFGGGTMMIITITSCSITAKPEKTYGLWVFGQVLLGAIALFFMPKLFKLWGLNACFAIALLIILIALPFHRYFADFFIEKPLDRSKSVVQNNSFGWLSIFSTLLFYIAIGGIWTFMSSISEHAKINTEFTHSILAISTIIGIVGCFLPVMIGDKLNRKYFLIFGYTLFLISLCLLLNQISQNGLMVSILLFKFTWMFTIPFVLASVASFDATGKLMNTVNLVVGGGLALGPFIAGKVIENTGNFNTLIIYSMIVLAISFALIYVCNLKKVVVSGV